MARRAARWTIESSDVAPAGDPLWIAAGPDVRAKFWRAVVVYGLKAHDEQTAAGLDRFGRTLTPIRESTRRNRRSAMGPADPAAPPLTPAYAVSRTRLNLTGRAETDRAVFWWTDGFGRILAYHARGARNLPVRDVIGLSPDSMRKVRRWADAWWLIWKRTGAAKPARIAREAPERLDRLGVRPTEDWTLGVGVGARTTVAESRRLIAAGKSTGFFRRGPGEGLPALGGPGTGVGPPPPRETLSLFAMIQKGLREFFRGRRRRR